MVRTRNSGWSVSYWMLVIALMASITANAQKQANVWYFGGAAGLTFNTSPPSGIDGGQTYSPAPNLWNEGTSSLCDISGSLLYYSNGTKVWNRKHQVMFNGSDLKGHPSSTAAALIIPRPRSERFAHVFTTDASENDFRNGMRHSVIDACLGNDMGDIVETEKNILLHGNMAEKLAAVQHANGIDYWVVGHEYGSNVFHVYLLTEYGVTDSLSIALGRSETIGWGGQMVFSPNGSTLAYASASSLGFMALYDFNTSNGMISNARNWNSTIDHMVWGLAFSPDGSKLYLTTSNQGSLRQLDMNANTWSDFQASEVNLGQLTPSYWMDLRLGPDELIYVTHAQSQTLGRINYPNAQGITCQFQDNSVPLIGTCSFGLPNVIAGYAYGNTFPPCGEPISPEIILGPNPAAEQISVRCGPCTIDDLMITDVSGRIVYSGFSSAVYEKTLDVSSLATGTYQISFRIDEDQRHTKRFVKQ